MMISKIKEVFNKVIKNSIGCVVELERNANICPHKAVKIAKDITLGLRREKYAPIVPRSALSLNLLGAIFAIYKVISND